MERDGLKIHLVFTATATVIAMCTARERTSMAQRERQLQVRSSNENGVIVSEEIALLVKCLLHVLVSSNH